MRESKIALIDKSRIAGSIADLAGSSIIAPRSFRAGSMEGIFGAASGRCISENIDTASCMAPAPCSSVNTNFSHLKWQAVYPQGHLSAAQGFIGQRKASFQGSQAQLYGKLSQIFNSFWPGPQVWCCDCLPVDIQWGATNEKVQVFGNIDDTAISSRLESFNDYYINVIYQYLRITDPWPINGKPAHPDKTTMTLRVRGGGEILQIDPTALADGGHGPNTTGCFTGVEPGAPQTFNSRIRIPLTEYHLTCDRITDAQLCNMMQMPWKCREGTVNCKPFLEECEGTLLFDTWTLDQTWVPDITEPRRWQVSCVLKCRQVPQMGGNYPDECLAEGCENPIGCGFAPGCYAIGWNHDFKIIQGGNFGWTFIMMNVFNNWSDAAAVTPHGNCPRPYVPRYPYMDFSDLFCTSSCYAPLSPSSGCINACPDPSVGKCTSITAEERPPRRPLSIADRRAKEPGYEALEAAIAKITKDSRGASTRQAARQDEARSRGEIETWADKKDSTSYWQERVGNETREQKEQLAEFKARVAYEESKKSHASSSGMPQ